MDEGDRPRPSPEDQAFLEELGALVAELMLLRNGDSTEDVVRERLEVVFSRVRALPVRGLSSPEGVRFTVYRGGGAEVLLQTSPPDPEGDGVA